MKINLSDKKKRGRPKKSHQLLNPSSNKIKINDEKHMKSYYFGNLNKSTKQ